MDSIEQRNSRIRDLVNNPWKQQILMLDRAKWRKVCSSMDVIGDTQIAINDYFSLPTFIGENGGYLFLYGLLQALFLQQDAISNLYHAIVGNTIKWESDYPDIHYIRELRNNSVGHPTKRGNDKSFHFISRHSLSKRNFTLMSYYSDNRESKFTDIDIDTLPKKQQKSAVIILDKVIEHMENEYEKHKSKFKMEKISDTIPNTFSYSLSKVREGVYNSDIAVKLNFDEIKLTIDEIKSKIIIRYGDLWLLQSLSDLIRRIDYIVKKLETWINDEKLLNNNDAEVFLDSFSDRFKELQEWIIEIDKEFE